MCALAACDLQIGYAGAKAIAEGLMDNPRLELLNLAHNALDDPGGAVMGELVKLNENIAHLDLSGLGPTASLYSHPGEENQAWSLWR